MRYSRNEHTHPPYKGCVRYALLARSGGDPHPKIPFPDLAGIEQLFASPLKSYAERGIGVAVAFDNKAGLAVAPPQSEHHAQRS